MANGVQKSIDDASAQDFEVRREWETPTLHRLQVEEAEGGGQSANADGMGFS